MEPPIPIERGDFIGIHYPRNTIQGVVTFSVPVDNVVDIAEMFQTYVLNANDEDFPTDRTVRMDTYPAQLEPRAYALLLHITADSGPGKGSSGLMDEVLLMLRGLCIMAAVMAWNENSLQLLQ